MDSVQFIYHNELIILYYNNYKTMYYESWVGEICGVAVFQLCSPGYNVQHQLRLDGRSSDITVIYHGNVKLSKSSAQQ